MNMTITYRYHILPEFKIKQIQEPNPRTEVDKSGIQRKDPEGTQCRGQKQEHQECFFKLFGQG